MLNICLLSRNHGSGTPPIKIPYSSLKSMNRGIVQKYINDHKDTAILRAASDAAKQEFPGTVAVVSYYVNNMIVHMPLQSGNANPQPHGSQDNFYSEDQPGFGSHIKKIIADIPSSGGKRRKRSTYKKRYTRRRKTQYHRRR